MTFPPGVSSVQVFINAPVSFGGTVARVHLEVTPNVRLVHAASGVPFVEFTDISDPIEGGIAQLTLPHSNQAGFVDESGTPVTSWSYQARIKYERGGEFIHAPLRHFSLLTGQTAPVDLSLIPSGAPSIPTTGKLPQVLSVEGMTGHVTGLATAEAVFEGHDKDAWNALRHGIVGDGIVDDGPAVNDFLVQSTLAGRTAFFPPGMVIRSTVTIAPPSNAKVSAAGAMFRCDTPGGSDELLGILNVSDVTWTGGTFDGNKASFPGVTEWRHAVNIIGSTRVRLQGMTATNAKGDGFYIGDDAAPCTDITFSNMRGKANARNGLALVAVKGFSDFGSTYEEQDGIHPMSGLDIEPNQPGTVVDQISFTACRFIKNKQYGMMVSLRDAPTVRQGGITFTDCVFDGNGGKVAGNGGYNVRLHNARDVRFVAGQIRAGFAEGVYFTGSSGDGVHFFGTEISKNGREGIRCAAPVANIELVGVRVIDNGQTLADTYDGLNFETGTGVTLVGVTSTGASQRYGLRTLQGVTNLSEQASNFGGNGRGPTSLSDDIASRVSIGRVSSRLGPVSVTGQLSVDRPVSGDSALSVRVAGDSQPRVLVRAEGDIRFGDGVTAGDVRLYRPSADVLRVNDSFTVDKTLTASEAVTMPNTAGLGYVEGREQVTTPAAPSANQYRIYAEDDGAGKTRLVVRFNTGAPVVLATEL